MFKAEVTKWGEMVKALNLTIKWRTCAGRDSHPRWRKRAPPP